MNEFPKKFLFDRDFSAPPAASSQPFQSGMDTPAPDREAIDAAFNEGMRHGRDLARLEQEAATADALSQIVSAIGSALAASDNDRAALEQDAVVLAHRLSTLYADNLIERNAEALIAAAVRRCAVHALNAPILTVTLSALVGSDVGAAIERAVSETGFAGRVLISSDQTLGRGDLRVDWPEGGFVRDRATIAAAIEDLLQTHAIPAELLSGESSE